MRILNRDIPLRSLLEKLGDLLKVAGRMGIFEHPIRVFLSYLSNKNIRDNRLSLKNGIRFHLGESPLDVTTAIVVFNKKEYGAMPQGGTVIDIGANIGMFSVYAVSNGAARVFAYEPNPDNFALLCRNIKENGMENRIFPFQMAVSDQEGEVFISTEASPLSHVKQEGGGLGFEKVLATNLPAILKENHIEKVDLLKMDCEGAEHFILSSLDMDTILKIQEIRMELHPVPQSSQDPYDSLRILLENGFEIQRDDRDLVWLRRHLSTTTADY